LERRSSTSSSARFGLSAAIVGLLLFIFTGYGDLSTAAERKRTTMTLNPAILARVSPSHGCNAGREGCRNSGFVRGPNGPDGTQSG
jgi:hypothetical protein